MYSLLLFSPVIINVIILLGGLLSVVYSWKGNLSYYETPYYFAMMIAPFFMAALNFIAIKDKPVYKVLIYTFIAVIADGIVTFLWMSIVMTWSCFDFSYYNLSDMIIALLVIPLIVAIVGVIAGKLLKKRKIITPLMLRKTTRIFMVTIVCILLIELVLIAVYCIQTENAYPLIYGESNLSAIDMPFEELITNPERYTGKLVRVKGYAFTEHENFTLHKENTFEFIRTNTSSKNTKIWLDLNGFIASEDYTKITRKDVIVEGVYNHNNSGFCNSSGAIEDITMVQVTSR